MANPSAQTPTTKGTPGNCSEPGQCPDERVARIYKYLDGALSHQDIDDVRAHLEKCESCAQEYDLECIIRSVVKRSCCEKAPQGLKVAIMERISEIKISATHD